MNGDATLRYGFRIPQWLHHKTVLALSGALPYSTMIPKIILCTAEPDNRVQKQKNCFVNFDQKKMRIRTK
jgi:hypothetical protein